MKQKSQRVNIKEHLETGHPITPKEALEHYGCFRLASVIHLLKSEGMDIKTTMVTKGRSTFALYRVVEAVSKRLRTQSENLILGSTASVMIGDE